jgi:ABC-type lipoprotein release transport system permease subunit
VQAGSELIELTAPVDASLLLLAIGLALLGGLVAGSVGGLRAARLRPADALRQID